MIPSDDYSIRVGVSLTEDIYFSVHIQIIDSFAFCNLIARAQSFCNSQ